MNIKPKEWAKSVVRKNNPYLPQSIRGLLIRKSGCGKTTLMMNLLQNDGWLDYNNLQIFGKALFQKEYKVLKEALEAGLPKQHIDNLFDKMKELEKEK